ncbi:hypothetical protein L484_022649 [Morus notabilis]|uniref:Uncharacterized protein n=1 Tax=Morus notabilis TaxID=981085 RepID=W9R5Q0_9ROSA|nr:hypothetical protein L484_022649 [Morus notabilis]
MLLTAIPKLAHGQTVIMLVRMFGGHQRFVPQAIANIFHNKIMDPFLDSLNTAFKPNAEF